MLFANLTVADNLVMRLGVPEIAVAGGFLSLGRMRATARELVSRFHVRTRSPSAPLPALSGGKQETVAIAAAIARRPALLVLEEPTRGVDVGSKAEIYRILRGYARGGHGVLVYCTEVPEVHELADRAVVVDRGHPVKELAIAEHPTLTGLADAIAGLEHTDPFARDPSGGSAGAAGMVH
jgi:ABC-type sugar transport system ATPase subunit